MCAICGCAADGHEHEHGPAHDHVHEHHGPGRHGHLPHGHRHEAPDPRGLEGAVLAKNDGIARKNREFLERHRMVALNLVSSPGAGKTTLLERTIAELRGQREVLVIEGDQETSYDADRIRRAGATAIQINTGAGCHLDAAMVERGLEELGARAGTFVFIENVGNLVCPALFDLGERAKVLVASVTEGEDKPLKYPHMFRASHLVLLNKVDLLPHVRFDVDVFVRNARRVNPALDVVPLSAASGASVERWYSWLRALDG